MRQVLVIMGEVIFTPDHATVQHVDHMFYEDDETAQEIAENIIDANIDGVESYVIPEFYKKPVIIEPQTH